MCLSVCACVCVCVCVCEYVCVCVSVTIKVAGTACNSATLQSGTVTQYSSDPSCVISTTIFTISVMIMCMCDYHYLCHNYVYVCDICSSLCDKYVHVTGNYHFCLYDV